MPVFILQGMVGKGMRLVALLAAALLHLTLAVGAFAAPDRTPVNILVLDSYNPSQPWSQAYYDGLTEAARAADRNILLYVEYLDRLRLTDGASFADLSAFLEKKYKNIKFSGIIANSNGASDFVRLYGDKLGPGAPTVLYSSQPDSESDRTISILSLQEDVEHSVKETIKIALEQNPAARDILIIQGDNAVSRGKVGVLTVRLGDVSTLPIRLLSGFSMEELKRTVSGLDRDTIVFCTVISSDSTGIHLIPRDVGRELAALCKAPIYSFWSTYAGSGFVGGHALDGAVAGAQSVAAILDYLKDGRFHPPYDVLRTFIDWDAVTRFGIDPATIPADATIVNQPPDMWAEYRHELMELGILLALLAASAVFWLSKLTVLNRKLRQSRDELEMRVKERTHELSDSEMRFHALSDAAFEGVVISRNGDIIEANSAILNLLGYELAEVLGKKAIDFVAEEEKENVLGKIQSGYSEPYEALCRKKDGTVFPSEVRGKSFTYRGEAVRVTALRDITEIKQAEFALREANEKLTKIAMYDGLTGVANRRSFDTRLEAEWRRMMRAEKSLSLIIFDIDFFKRYNDTYGHQAGDACLQAVAKSLLTFFKRPGDLLARYGGEEFVVILPETSDEGATILAEMIRVQIQGLDIIHEASAVATHVTVSCGVSSVVPTQSSNPHALLEMADRALYEAKGSGRNKVVTRRLEH